MHEISFYKYTCMHTRLHMHTYMCTRYVYIFFLIMILLPEPCSAICIYDQAETFVNQFVLFPLVLSFQNVTSR